MLKRDFLKKIAKLFLLFTIIPSKVFAAVSKVIKTNAEWKKLLTPAQYDILRNEGTEQPFTSPLNNEKREGEYVCAGCNTKLFHSSMKYDSGTGWPSFFQHYPGVIGTKVDFKMIIPRIEYHCLVCEGHHGHVFDDGPEPTGKRFCNNGIVLKFIAKKLS